MNKFRKFLSFCLGLLFSWAIVYFITNHFFENPYIIKYDFVLQHIPFYEEFLRLLSKGLPFWSFNSFMGLNFWASKGYYLIGDPFAWLGTLYRENHSVIEILSMLFRIKLYFMTVTAYLWFSNYKLKLPFHILLTLLYVFSGWNLVFMEHPMYTSFYAVLPLMFYGLDVFRIYRHGFWVWLSAALLISINFYLFWVASIIVLIYWLTNSLYHSITIRRFLIDSLMLIAYFALGVLISAVIWLPSILHLLQSSRLGSNTTIYSVWSDTNIASFIAYAMVPMLKNLDGVFKDYWYYFNQVGLYIGLLAWFIIPQAILSSKTKKQKWTLLSLMILLFVLLMSPKVGLIFHFTYSLRYTLVHTILGLWMMVLAFEHLDRINGYLVGISLALILLAYGLIQNHFLPLVHPILPSQLEELTLLNRIPVLSILYALLLISYQYLKSKSRLLSTVGFLLLFVSIYEINTNAKAALVSQQHVDPLLYQDQDFKNAIEYLKSIDSSFYRIYTDQISVSNIGLVYNISTQSTYDTTYQYSLTDFLHLTRQYPESNWEFRLNDPTLTSLVGIKYGIVKEITIDNSMTDPWFADELVTDQDFGPYKIIQYKEAVHFASTSTQIEDISILLEKDIESTDYRVNELAGALKRSIFLDLNTYPIQSWMSSISNETVTVDSIIQKSNTIEFDITTNSNSLLFTRMAYDDGWLISSNSQTLKTLPVQGGFLGILVPEGTHIIKMSYVPPGFDLGLNLTKLGVFLALLSELLCLSYLIFKRLKPSSK